LKELTQSFLTKEKLNQDMENPEKRLGNIDSFLPDSFKKRKGGQRMWRDTIIVEEDNRIVATGDNVRMNTREIADLFIITTASVNRAVKRVLKSDVLNDYEVVKLVRLDNGLLLEFYSLEPIIVLSYKWNTFYTFAIGIRESSQLTRSTRLRQSEHSRTTP
jgi:hypothetical protein